MVSHAGKTKPYLPDLLSVPSKVNGLIMNWDNELDKISAVIITIKIEVARLPILCRPETSTSNPLPM